MSASHMMSPETYSGLTANYDFSTPSSTSHPTSSQGSHGTLSPLALTPDSNLGTSPFEYPLDWQPMWPSVSEGLNIPPQLLHKSGYYRGLEEVTTASTSKGLQAIPAPSSSRKPNQEEPYAKLIQKALLSVESHKMQLQEIYQWFRENTERGKSATKGWQNSIRHNLSMNAAFLKCERGGTDGVRKSTEWQLAPFAIHGSVQSTTRYRKGNLPRRLNEAARASSSRRGRPSMNKSISADMRRSVLTRPVNTAILYSHNYSGIGASNDHMNYNYPAPRPLFSDPNWMGPLSSHAEVPTVGFEFLLSSSNGILPSLPEPVENDYEDMKFAHGEA
ncbi:hypothetical protein F4680DRAFT_465801 [Xylaria scruposa]|nr:hypothetical protein F4680DRAFT_465801 [Xylaria scruposa]